MKKFILLLAFTIASSLMLASCDRAASSAQAQREKQQETKDRDVLRGKFEKSPGKSY